MKRIIALILTFALALTLAASLTSCKKNNDGAPEGMQLAAGSDALGYYFFAPEEWVVANQGNIKATYVSSIDYSSVTFTETNINYNTLEASFKDAVAAAFKKNEAGYLDKPFSNYVLKINGEECTFGNVTGAYKYVFEYTYEKKIYKCMQIFASYDGASYVFTYNASNQDYSEEATYYEFYLTEKVQGIIDNFKFVKKSGKLEDEKYTADESGNLLVSDKSKCDFNLWVPEEYAVDYSSGMVSVTNAAGANITVCKLINSAISIKDNFLERCDLLSSLADKRVSDTGEAEPDFDIITGVLKNDAGEEHMKVIDVSCARSAALVEYRYTLDGEGYRVYQVFLVNGYFNVEAFVFTFTCPEDKFESELEKAKKILVNMEL